MTLDLGRHRVHVGDCLPWLRSLPDESVDAAVTDPPYGLGFMGRAWDALPPGREVFAELLRVLKPGGHVVAFGGTRTYHRLACAAEDAGLDVVDMLVWLHGQGRPSTAKRLKPGQEPALLAVKGGVCGLQIEAGRLATMPMPSANKTPSATQRHAFGVGLQDSRRRMQHAARLDAGEIPGRWPANVAHDGSDDVEVALAAFGERTSRWGKTSAGKQPSAGYSGGIPASLTAQARSVGDTGTASRFYFCAKASPAERASARHPTVKPLSLMRWLVRLVTPPGGVVVDPFLGSGTTLLACEAEGMTCLGAELGGDPDEVSAHPHVDDILARWEARTTIIAGQERRDAARTPHPALFANAS